MQPTVLLLHPPPYLFEGSDPFGAVNQIVPIGLYALAEFLRMRGREVRLARLALLALRRAAGRGVESTDWDEVLREALGPTSPSLIAVQAHWSFYAEGAAEVVRRARRLAPSSRIVMGGVHASGLAGLILRELPELDAVIVGEAEGALDRLAMGEIPAAAIPGVATREGALVPGSGVAPAELPVLRFDKTLLEPAEDARFVGVPVVRGACPKPCTYCELNHRGIWTRKQLILNPSLDAQIELAAGAGVPLYLPENFVGEKPLLRLLERVGETPGAGPVYVDCHPDMLTDGVLDRLGALAAAGVRLRLWLGVESGSATVRERAGRRYNAARISTIRDRLLAAGIRPTASVLVGLPGEGRDELRETSTWLAHWNEAGLLADVFPVLAFPGTTLHRDPERLGLTLRFRGARDFERLSRAWFAPLDEEALPQTNGRLSGHEVVAAVLRLRLEQRKRLHLPVVPEALTLMGHPAAAVPREAFLRSLEKVERLWPLDLKMPRIAGEETP